MGIVGSFRIFSFALALSMGPALSREADYAGPQREARAVFAVLGVKLETATRCEIAKDWERESISLDLARKYLKAQTTLHAEFIAPDFPLKTNSILDPNNEYASAFCTADEMREFSATIKQEIASSEIGARGTVNSKKYSFPVFDSKFQRAVLIVTSGGTSYKRTPTGLWSSGWEGHSEAMVFEKTHGQWRLVTNALLWTT